MTTDDYNDKFDHEEEHADERPIGDAASRARNQTVMLTPEVTGQVRALLNKNQGKQGGADPLSELLPPVSSSSTWDAAPETQSPVSAPPVGSPLSADQNVTTVFSKDSLQTDRPHFDARSSGGFSHTGEFQGASREPLLSQNNQPGFGLQGGFGAGQSAGQAPTMSQVVPSPMNQTMGQPMQAQMNLNVMNHVEPAPAVKRVQERKTKIVGFLISYDNNEAGEIFEIGAGRWLITSKATEHGEFILIDDETVSPLHAIIRAKKTGKIQILDQLSEHGTGVTAPEEEEEEEVAGTMVSVEHGSLVRFGKRYFVVCVVPQVDVWEGEEE